MSGFYNLSGDQRMILEVQSHSNTDFQDFYNRDICTFFFDRQKQKHSRSTLFFSLLLLGNTTNGNKEDRRTKEFPVTELPQPIQDPIQVARKLDQRYLCIDSTYINQDNHEDWNTGSKKMEAVSQDIYYTIAATSAEDSTKGFPNRPLLAENSNYVT
ncbi:uncharacterized protein RSE6_04816 [Rhynchosporium secalis]|uniref:Heterokaryon incompatibility domain-containing protein n=1 Tax=Rhynchosporium secalis TaxID=38038 RepID=A0A1E1M692_RHYSE|nr:uncharacterized protein RSE6_04816 [Rhynchosporium secalis]